MPAYRRGMLILSALAALVAGCGKDEPETPIAGRWYTEEQVERGNALFLTHCASCHGDHAQGLAEDWRRTDESGIYPPPPLNGSAHAWHHPMVVLERTIADGGAAFGGVMPGFADELSEEDARATIAYFQSLWPGEVYSRWSEINER